MNNVILMLKISTVALAVLVVILVVLTVLWIRAELRAKRAEASLKVYREKINYGIDRPRSPSSHDITSLAVFDPVSGRCAWTGKASDAISEADILDEEDDGGER